MLIIQSCSKTVDNFNPFNPEDNKISNIKNSQKNGEDVFALARRAPLIENFSERGGNPGGSVLSSTETLPVRESYVFAGIKHYIIYIDFSATAYGEDMNGEGNMILSYQPSHTLIKVTPFGTYSIGNVKDGGFDPPAQSLNLSWHYKCSGSIDFGMFGIRIFPTVDKTANIGFNAAWML